MQPQIDTPSVLLEPLTVGRHTFTSRLIVGTGKYADYEVMREAVSASGAEVVTVAVRRERLIDAQGRSILDFLDTERLTILPNTAGCFTAEDAVRVARLGREILEQLDNPGKDWVKLEVLGDRRTLLPDPVGTLEACRELVADGFDVLCYTSDDPIMAVRLRDAGAASVMPAGSPIGSGRGVANPAAIATIVELIRGSPALLGSPALRAGSPGGPTLRVGSPGTPVVPSATHDSERRATNSGPALRVGSDTPGSESRGTNTCPVIVDAGVGTPSDVTIAMELGADGVLLNTGIAHAKDPVRMAIAMKAACEAGYLGFRAGRIPKRMYASASSPWDETISQIPGE